jgi:uncharacterized repeat protein (TIGR03803 family)
MPFLATLALAAALAHGQTYIDLHDFGATSTDGKNLYGGVTIDANGNVYGTASGGGLYGGGTVWEITAAGLYKDLHDFGSGTDGITPRGVTFDRAGNLFGTTSGGGLRGPNDLEKGYGTIWEITNKGIYEPVYEFQGAAKDDGQNPFAGVTFDGVGNMYGTTTFGGPPGQFSAQIGFGIVWEITTAGVYKVLHDFGNGTDGQYPWAGVTFDAAGNMFGATSAGGFKDIGMIWEITNKGVYNDVYEFGTGGAGGQNPQADVTLDAAGNMYGTASQGGAVFETSPGFGDVWELTKAICTEQPAKAAAMGTRAAGRGTESSGRLRRPVLTRTFTISVKARMGVLPMPGSPWMLEGTCTERPSTVASMGLKMAAA